MIPHILWHQGGLLSEIVLIVLIIALSPAVALWRRRPFLSASAIAVILAVWFVTVGGEPVDFLDLVPFVCCVPLAVYGTARYGSLRGAFIFLVGSYLFAVAVIVVSGVELKSALSAVVVAVQWMFFTGVFVLASVQREDMTRREDELRARGRDMRLAMAREIHDTLSRTLTVINVQATAGAAGQDLSALDRIRELSGGSLAEVRGLIASLRASGDILEEGAVDPGELVSAMGKMLGGFRDVGLHIDTVFPTGADRDKLVETESSAVQFTVYRILGEALTNVLRHQGVASRVMVMAMPDMAVNTLNVRVESWGATGAVRAPEVPGSGVGLTGMRGRVEQLGGVFEWHGSGGTGCHFVVEAQLPIVLAPKRHRYRSRPLLGLPHHLLRRKPCP